MSTNVVANVSELERRTIAKVKRYIFAYFITGQICYQFDRSNIGFAQLTMGRDLHLSAHTFGLAAGIIAFSSFLMQVPAGLCFEKLGARKWLTFIMLAWGFAVMGQAFVHSALSLTILRFFLGVFEAGFLPGLYILAGIWFRGKDQAKVMSYYLMGLALSFIIGGPLAGWILGKHFFGLAGWRNLFLIEGVATIIWAVFASRIINDNPAKTPWLKPDEREFMVKYLSEYQAQKSDLGAVVTTKMWSMLKDYRIVLLLIAWSLSGWTAGTFTFFNPTLLKRAGIGVSNQYVGFLAMGPYVCSAVFGYLWGRHADKTELHYHSVLPLVLAATGMLLYPVAAGPLFAMVCLSMVQVGNGAFLGIFWPSCHMVVGKPSIARVTALMQAGQMLCQFVAPITFGWMLDVTGGTSMGLYTCVGVVFLNFVFMNVFFFRYKAQQKTRAATAGEG